MATRRGEAIRGQRDRHYWGIILAGGEGKRLQPFLLRECGLNRPKQFCAIVGRRSMLRHTIDRASTLIHPSRLLTVINRHHLAFALEDLYDRDPRRIITVPFNCETGASILLALMRIHAEDPKAVVVIFPSDHFIHREDQFMNYVRGACSFVEKMPGFIVSLGIVPTAVQPGYGWIETGNVLDRRGSMSLFRINRFWEKPNAELTQKLFGSGCLWNTLTLTGTASKFIRLFSEYTPDIFQSFLRIRNAFGTPEETRVTYEVFLKLASVNFSSAILERSPAHLAVLPVTDVYWSDWGEEARVRADLQLLAEQKKRTREPENVLSTRWSKLPAASESLTKSLVIEGVGQSIP